MFFNPKLAIASVVAVGVLFCAFVTGTLINRYTDILYDPALKLSLIIWVGGALLVWIAYRVKLARKG